MTSYIIQLPNMGAFTTIDDKLFYIKCKLKEVETIEYRNKHSKDNVINDRRIYTNAFKNLLAIKSIEQKNIEQNIIKSTFNQREIDELYS